MIFGARGDKGPVGRPGRDQCRDILKRGNRRLLPILQFRCNPRGQIPVAVDQCRQNAIAAFRCQLLHVPGVKDANAPDTDHRDPHQSRYLP